MSGLHALAEHLAPDSINLLERAAQQRMSDATWVGKDERRLARFTCWVMRSKCA